MTKTGPGVTPIPVALPQEYDPAVPLGQLTPHPANPNHGDSGLIGELLEANGFAGAALAQKSTGLIIDGEHRWIAAGQHGMATIPVLWIDCDDDTRDRLLASLNESTRRGLNDETKLVALLKGLAVTPRGLAGTAFDGDRLDDMIRLLTPPDLDDLHGQYGDPADDDLWPMLRFKVPPGTPDRFRDLTGSAPDSTDTARFLYLLTLAETGQ